MSTATKRPRAEILPVATELRQLVAGGCDRIEIAGSLRRERSEVGDIELVAIPKVETVIRPIAGDLFGDSKPVEVNRLWEQLDFTVGRSYTKCGPRYRQFVYKGVKVDLFTATPNTWGWIFLIRTGPWEFSHHVAVALNKASYTGTGGAIHKGELKLVDGAWKLVPKGDPIKTPTEQDVFDLARIPFREPRQRN